MEQRTAMIAFWVLAPLVYAAFLLYDILQARAFFDTIGLMLSMVWALIGAALASSGRHNISAVF
jgi:hypothetical protein